MGYRHQKPELMAAALELVGEDGLSRLTFGRLAARLGIADRTVVYYFPTKDQLLTEVIGELALQLMGILGEAFGDEPLPRDELLRRAWPVLATETADPIFRIFFELTGLAAAGTAPYADLVPSLMGAWLTWLETKLRPTSDDSGLTARSGTESVAHPGDPDGDRSGDAAHVVALIDGLLLVRLTAGPEAADRAAASLGLI